MGRDQLGVGKRHGAAGGGFPGAAAGLTPRCASPTGMKTSCGSKARASRHSAACPAAPGKAPQLQSLSRTLTVNTTKNLQRAVDTQPPRSRSQSDQPGTTQGNKGCCRCRHFSFGEVDKDLELWVWGAVLAVRTRVVRDRGRCLCSPWGWSAWCTQGRAHRGVCTWQSKFGARCSCLSASTQGKGPLVK